MTVRILPASLFARWSALAVHAPILWALSSRPGTSTCTCTCTSLALPHPPPPGYCSVLQISSCSRLSHQRKQCIGLQLAASSSTHFVVWHGFPCLWSTMLTWVMTPGWGLFMTIPLSLVMFPRVRDVGANRPSLEFIMGASVQTWLWSKCCPQPESFLGGVSVLCRSYLLWLKKYQSIKSVNSIKGFISYSFKIHAHQKKHACKKIHKKY